MPPTFPPGWTTKTIGPGRISLAVMPSYRGARNVTVRVPLRALRHYGRFMDFRAVKAVPSVAGKLQFSRARKLSMVSWHHVLYLVAALPRTMHWTLFIEFDLAPRVGEATLALTGRTSCGWLSLGGFLPPNITSGPASPTAAG